MSQATNVIASGSGVAVRTAINAALAAINSGHSGTTVPAYAAGGMLYWRTDVPGGGIWTLYAYDGASSVALGTLNTSTHAWAPVGSVLPIANAGGTVDAITADFSPDVTIADNLLVSVVSAGVNTVTNPTLSADGNTARTIKRNGGQALIPGDTGPAGNTMLLRYEATGTYWELLNPRMPIGTGSTQTGAVATGTTTIPSDDSIPQSTEGNQYMTLSYTTKSATSKLEIIVRFCGGHDTSGNWVTAALFKDSDANALKAASIYQGTGSAPFIIDLFHEMDSPGAGTTIDFKVRAGPNTSGTTTFNGVAGGRIFAGVMNSGIWVREVNL